ncbi:MAG: hypothetical protein V1915_00695 [Candidatus Bathyarchaeota archaeon]
MLVQTNMFRVTGHEQRRNLCSTCRGHKRLCGKTLCPILAKAEALVRIEKGLSKENVFGSSPPAVFVGSWNYPKVLAGPLVPPLSDEDTSIMDMPEQWVNKSFQEILQYRLSLVRGERFTDVRSAKSPDRTTTTFQELVMSSQPTDTEMWFTKKPKLSLVFSPREPPSGPSASISRAVLTENPRIPRFVDEVVADTDLNANQGIWRLYDSQINPRQITRMLSIGLLGVERQRRLVPTEWSITAVDDILGRAIHKEILTYPWVNECLIFGHQALANNIQILLFPSSWMFEAQEAWLTSSQPTPEVDYEFLPGRRSYASNLEGAYYAVRLPLLEYLRQIRRQAGAVVFMEVYPEWIPLGVWRFREICREALRRDPLKVKTVGEALNELKKRLRLPLQRWLERSEILRWQKAQTRLTKFFS